MDRGFLSNSELKSLQGRVYYGVVVTILLVLALAVLFPFLYAFTSGLKGSTEIFTSGLNIVPENPQWGNYKTAWTEFRMAKLFKNSMVIVTGSVVLQMIISCLAAYSLSNLKPIGGRVVMFGFLLTLMVPAIAYFVPLFVTLGNLPVLETSLLDSYWGLWLPYAVSAFTIFVLKNFFERIPGEIIDSAKIDGASSLQTFIYIVLPLSRSIIIILSILSFTGIWREYLLPLLIISNPEEQPITVRLIYLADNYGINIQMAAAFTAMLPPLLVAIILQRFMRDGLTIGFSK